MTSPRSLFLSSPTSLAEHLLRRPSWPQIAVAIPLLRRLRPPHLLDRILAPSMAPSTEIRQHRELLPHFVASIGRFLYPYPPLSHKTGPEEPFGLCPQRHVRLANLPFSGSQRESTSHMTPRPLHLHLHRLRLLQICLHRLVVVFAFHCSTVDGIRR